MGQIAGTLRIHVRATKEVLLGPRKRKTQVHFEKDESSEDSRYSYEKVSVDGL